MIIDGHYADDMGFSHTDAPYRPLVLVIIRPFFTVRPPSKGLMTPASLWYSSAAVQRLPLSRAKTVFDVPRRRGRLGTLAPAFMCCGNAHSQRHPRCNRFHSRMGD